MKFKPGQQVTPVKKQFNHVFGKPMASDVLPKFGIVYTVTGYPHDFPWTDGCLYMWLDEFPEDCIYNENGFAPLISDEELNEALKESEMVKC